MAVFLDSNIVLYALGEDSYKRGIAATLLAQKAYISTKVVNECSHVLQRKRLFSPDIVEKTMSAIISATHLAVVGIEEIRAAWGISARYGFGHYDSLIVATALACDCATLYTEDLQHRQIIERRLVVSNPFLTF